MVLGGLYYFLLPFQLLVIYFISRASINELFKFFIRVFKKEKIAYYLICLLFFPGTVVHEMAHFITAIILFLRVRDIKLLPVIENRHIRLGTVTYEKKDVFRSVLVGIAPLFVGLFLFWSLARSEIFPSDNVIVNLLLGYLTFSISSTMFSSRQDLVDLLYIIPLIIMICGVVYIFKIDINEILLKPEFVKAMKAINLYMFFPLLVNIGSLLLLKLLNRK